MNGASNLWFCFLSVKLLLCRVAYKVLRHLDYSFENCSRLRQTAIRKPDVLPGEKLFRLAALKDSAINVAEYMRGLTDENLLEFWLPCPSPCSLQMVNLRLRRTDTAYLLVSTATTLLRAAIESSEEAKANCVRVLLGLSGRLMAARDTLGWDIGDFCLQRCKPTIDKLATALGLHDADYAPRAEQIDTPARVVAPVGGDENPGMGLDLLLPLDSLDYQFDLFDDFAGPWAVNG